MFMLSFKYCGYIMTGEYNCNKGSDNINEHFGFVV